MLVDKRKAVANISTMQATAAAAQVALRPHFKTHQSVPIGEWFGPAPSTAIAVSSVAMATRFATAGWRDILLAIPLNPGALSHYQQLAQQLRLGLTIEHEDALDTVAAVQAPVDIYVELDAGYGRTGLAITQVARIDALLHRAQALSNVRQLGLLLHAGNSYSSRGDDAIAAVHQHSLSALAQLLDQLSFPRQQLRISVGDTPTCSRMREFPGADEIRPGNYVFYDLMQQQIGACNWSQVALALACPVIARYPERGEVVVHGGAVHFSKDFVLINGQPVYGQVMQTSPDGWGEPLPQAQLIGLSQEHGKIRMPAEQIAQLRLGEVLVIVPAHSCLVMDASQGQCQIIN
ncbi:alanine racemase [Pseudidiomarina mangrovi]|uniref:alanine racemase n=1 Tax=Pseudidiomarina mangrovi TaxID=2487133 RepID=UPI0013DFECE7|nr:alanine racemase [Pseudidiomarina mangrovi]